MYAVVDIQGFNTEPNTFIPKEIVIKSDINDLNLLIKPPFPFKDLSDKEKRVASWMKKNKNLLWNEGYVPYWNYANCMELLKSKQIFVKGKGKEKWLQGTLSEDDDSDAESSCKTNNNIIFVKNLEDYKCPPFSVLYKTYKLKDMIPCDYHIGRCAYTNAQCLYKWSLDNKIFK